ncbi:MAG: deoxyribose-phosphate aldolase [Nitrososphaerota archaeon]|jgi:deoxyribose-phosphate aldolase|nr:deoxyribose-phosphate aldolase [Nitrososphaerota archaeon]MDG6930236.1 deoxyribose-phosphate aldolase [Nitrososphaerota archaeon]MDG6932640.1 deoxyribose-phosphate aldolase [Nitrososphaerota archaeon]MDG6935568.1 deoxyribose-phosphate aldolase [Nitrososphaerota archaeon]MDG6944012.1 deoxyribose-phosphate aldolase [Nitrososphaerota archaeon]
MKKEELAKMIDHTQLNPFATENDIKKLCEEARKYHFFSVIVNPYYVKLARELVKGTDVKVLSVIGFPFGVTYKEVKVLESEMAVKDGADELDMVMNISAAKSGKWDVVKDDIAAVSKVAKSHGKLLKVIIETGYLTDDEKVKACQVAVDAGADFVKTSTGFGKGGATVHDVELMAKTVKGKAKVKAAGGIHSAKDAMDMINAGASRIGASHSVEIVEELK